MRQLKYVKCVMMLSVAWVAGCNLSPTAPGTNSSVLTKGISLPPGTNAILAVKSTAGAGTAAAKASTASAQVVPSETVTLDSASILIKEIKLRESPDRESGEDAMKFELEGPFLVDLIAETVRNLGESNVDDDADDDGVADVDDSDDDGDGIPDVDDDDDDGDGIPDEADQTVGEVRLFDAIELPEGTYHRIEFKLDSLDAEDAPSPDEPMIGFSILVTGSIMASDGTMVPMEYCASFEEELEFRSTDGIVVEPNIVATFLLSVDPVGWFAGVDPAAGTLSDDGVLRICGDLNPDLADIVRSAIRDRARLGRDEDGDGNDDNDENGDLEDDDSGGNDEGNDDPSSPNTSMDG